MRRRSFGEICSHCKIGLMLILFLPPYFHCSRRTNTWSDDCTRVAMTLSWCEQSQVDLDLWVFTPDTTRAVSVDQDRALYWNNRNIAGGSNYNMFLELDDLGLPAGQGSRSFGPESLYLKGDLPEGMYAVMVHAYTQNPQSTLDGNCPSVSLYSNFTQGVSTSNSDDTATPCPSCPRAPPLPPLSCLHNGLLRRHSWATRVMRGRLTGGFVTCVYVFALRSDIGGSRRKGAKGQLVACAQSHRHNLVDFELEDV